MPENNSVALGINANPIDLRQTLGTLSQLELSQAHAGLYGLQAQQEARKLYANKAIQQYGLTPEGITEFAKRGGDPAAIEGYQKGFATNNAFSRTGGLMPGDLKTLSEIPKIGAETQRTLAEIPKIGAETQRTLSEIPKIGAETKNVQFEGEQKQNDLRARYAQSVIADPGNDDNWRHVVDTGISMMPGSELQKASRRKELLSIADPQARVRIAESAIWSGMSAADYTALHNVSPTESVISRGGMRGSQTFSPPPGTMGAAPMPNAPVANRFGAIPPMVTPEQATEIKSKGDYAKEALEASGKAYTAAQSLLQRIPVIAHDIETLGPAWMGTGAETKTAFAKGWNSIVDTVAGLTGIKPNQKMMFDPTKIATSEELYKEQIRAGMELINSNFGGSREAASIIQMGRSAVSGQGNTYLGAKFVLSTIEAAAQRQADLHEFKLEDKGPLASAEVRFNKLHPPQSYGMKAMAGSLPPEAISYLQSNPALAKQFDSKYHVPGLAKYVLGAQ